MGLWDFVKNAGKALGIGDGKAEEAPPAPEALKQEKLEQGIGLAGDCITVEKGTLTVVDLSGHFVDPSTACTLFDICLAVILKRHQAAVNEKRISPGLIVTLDEAHKYLDSANPAAGRLTSSLLTTIREQRHNAARVIIATQEPSISGSLLDLCSVSQFAGLVRSNSRPPGWRFQDGQGRRGRREG